MAGQAKQAQAPLGKDYMVHCAGGCSRGEWRDLKGVKPSEVRCECGSDKVAIWQHRNCLYSWSGKVDYPMGDTPFGTPVRGGVR